ncbi:MAG: phosphatase [Bacteroidetes bacterium]|jgi:3-deoxy-D-manno-octulosonate 8-phosphate phosphatase (KDO 8-P phosphatase)|nr:MAG: phosphatase [Bacteroidota bacterium]
MNTVFEKFSLRGGQFLINDKLFINQLEKVKLFIFDWDGVFTNGLKDADLQSQFNESDSVGLNLLRFSYYLKHHQHPYVAIISGEKNLSAFTLVKREFIHKHYFKIPHKIKAFEHLCESLGISEEETCFVFDDILDLSIAERCGLRLFVRKPSAVLFTEYVIKNQLADYISFSDGSYHAVREICELLMGCYNNFEDVLEERIHFTSRYQKYLELKRSIQIENYTFVENKIIQVKE